jgi:hypothetical protein
MLGKQRLAGVERDWRILNDIYGSELAAQRLNYLQHGLERGDDMSFHAAQRAEPKARQFALKLSHVMAPHSEIVDEIDGALAHRGRDLLEFGAKLLLSGTGSAVQPLDAPLNSPEPNRPGNLAFCSLLGYHRMSSPEVSNDNASHDSGMTDT